METTSPLRVLYLSAEAEPFIRVGGLGDVAGALPVALRSLNLPLDIRLMLPFHGMISRSNTEFQQLGSFQVAHSAGQINAQVYANTRSATPAYLIGGDPIRPNLPVYSSDWGYDAYKYIFFSLAALEACRQQNWQPQIVHANDWATAAAVYWLALHRDHDPFFQRTASLLTVHNLAYIGCDAGLSMHGFRLPSRSHPMLPTWAKQLPLPLAMLTVDQIVTVSPAYAQEIQLPEFGAGLDSMLRSRQANLCGILNGIDTTRWDPANDPYLSINYTHTTLNLRTANKIALLSQLGFLTGGPQEQGQTTPLIAMISDLDYPQGFDLALQALQQLIEKDRTQAGAPPAWRAVLLGVGLPELEAAARRLEDHYPDRVRMALRQDSLLGHQLYGAADIFLAPARTNPGGQNHMIAMRYGCVPVAQATGVLQDTIDDRAETRTGFLYDGPNIQPLVKTLQTALSAYQNRPLWQAIQQRAMQQDFSWQRAARAYYGLYTNLAQARLEQLQKQKPESLDPTEEIHG